MVFHWSLSDSKTPFSWTLLNTLVNFNNAVICMVLISFQISYYNNIPFPSLCKPFQLFQSYLASSSPSCHILYYHYYYYYCCCCCYYHYYYYYFRVFHISVSWWFFTWVWVTASLLKSQGSSQDSGRFSNAVILIVSTRPPTSKSSRPFNNPLVIAPKAAITIGSLCPRGVMVKAMNCGIVVREFVLQSRYYVHFRANTLGKGMNPLILPPAMGK